MEKLITLRYAAKCKRCGETLAAGSRAVWLGAKAGVQHQTCTPAKAQQEPPKPKKSREGESRMTFDYSAIRNAFAEFCKSPMNVYREKKNDNRGKSLLELWERSDAWAGCSIPEMNEFIRAGYRVEGLEGISSLIPAKPRRKIRYAEEGDELLIDLAFSGSDEPFMEWEKRVSKPGLSVEIVMTFSANVPPATIVQYQRWIARALQTLDENGVDMEVLLSVPCRGADDTDYMKRHNTLIRVRNAGEASDFSSWSPMFSPGGFRMLGIMATGMHVDQTGGHVSYGYGQPQAYGEWTVAYDEENSRIVIGNVNDAYGTFPEFQMTEKLQAVLAKLNG